MSETAPPDTSNSIAATHLHDDVATSALEKQGPNTDEGNNLGSVLEPGDGHVIGSNGEDPRIAPHVNNADEVSQDMEQLQITKEEQDSHKTQDLKSATTTEAPGVYDGLEALAAISGGPSTKEPQLHTESPYAQTPQETPIGPRATPGSQSKTQDEVPGESGKESGEIYDNDSRSEIQSIMEQFENQDENEQPLEDTPVGGNDEPASHPPRNSSLSSQDPVSSPASKTMSQTSAVSSPIKPPLRHLSFSQTGRASANDQITASTPLQSPALNKALPPAPDPEPDLPFDFHRFLEQLRHRKADSVAKYLRSFLQEFGKKQWMVHEQVKIISDFLAFIANKMALCDIWRGVSDAEFDNAREGMEKLVMNRLYTQTFSPAIAPPAAISPPKGKSRDNTRQPGPGRRGQHQEDVERDEVLAQKVRIYGWVREEHLDIAPVGKSGQRFLSMAQQELLKMKSYRAPRDKVICVLNCCKVIFGLLRNSKEADTSADAFVPLLIYVILRANPEHLVSNVQYISRFRNPDKLGGEAGYYLSSLMGAIQFIENLDRTALTVSDEDFEKNVEAAVSAIAERKSMDMVPAELPGNAQLLPAQYSEKGDRTPRASSESRARPNTDGSGSSGSGTAFSEQTPVGGLLKTIQKPLSSIGRIFSEEVSPAGGDRSPVPATHPDANPRLSPAVFQPPRRSSDRGPSPAPQGLEASPSLRAADAAARQASVETAEAHRVQQAEHHDVVETLVGMFPNLDRDVISDVVRMKDGRVGSAVDACLALNG